MNGKTAFISRGAEIGTTRGMLIVVSAGNEGNDAWKYITAPADSPSVITVGAVDSSGNIAGFSSFGPSADNRVKPEILAQGQNTSIINYLTGLVTTSNGTSFSAPIIAGLIACMNENEGFILKSSGFNPKRDSSLNVNLKKAVYESSDRYKNPHEQYGYGIPNFETALNSYKSSLPVDEQNFIKGISVYSNPVFSTFTLKINNIDLSSLSIQIFNVIGKKVYEEKKLKNKTINVSHLNTGIYILKIMNETQQKIIKLIKR
jgi:subtilisin family serine protease